MKLKSTFAALIVALIALTVSSCTSKKESCSAYQSIDIEEVDSRTGSK